jgi:hypothetical protein
VTGVVRPDWYRVGTGIGGRYLGRRAVGLADGDGDSADRQVGRTMTIRNAVAM